MAGGQRDQVRDAQRRDHAGGQLDAGARRRQRAAAPRRTTRRWSLIGPFNSGASAIVIPITNEAAVPMISPSNTAIGLTTAGAGAEPGEPDKYYPTGERTYFRIMPNDRVQADALATAMRDAGCRRVGAVHDGEVYGQGVGDADAARRSRGSG